MLRTIERVDVGPFETGYIEEELMASWSQFRMSFEPLRQFRTEIAKGEGG